MREKDLEKFRKQLLILKNELQDLTESSRESTRPVKLDQTAVGRLSRMDAMQGQQMALESARRRQQELARIDGALRRIESGDFGFCYACGEPINEQRLALDPANARCLQCAEN